MNKFVNLHLHTTYSLLDGLFYPNKYLEKLKELGGFSCAITEHGNLNSSFDFWDKANKHGIKPILGVESYFVDDKTSKEKPCHIILLAKNKKGYESLLKAQYDSCVNGFYRKNRIDWNNLKEMKGNVIVSTACTSGVVARPFIDKDMSRVKFVVERLKDWFGDDFYFEYVALSREYYKPIWQGMYEITQKYGIKSIISCDVHYIHHTDYRLQQILHNINNKITMEEMAKDKDKGWQMEDKDLYLKTYDQIIEIMKNVFPVNQVQEFLANTLEIDNKIEKYNIFPEKFVFPKVEFSEEEMKDTIKKNLKIKCDQNNIAVYRDRVKYEWGVIKRMGFLEYFYIVADIVNWSKQNKIMCGAGRGSAAGSLISYLLNITEIDPVKYDLSFTRFMNLYRLKMPDIDCDFQHSKRQQVLSYVKKYGEENVVQIVAHHPFKIKNTFKDVARIFGISAEEANIITKRMLGDDDNNDVLPTIKEIINILYPQNETDLMEPEQKELVLKKIVEITSVYEKILHYTGQLKGNIRHMSRHAAAVVITDKPVYDYLPVIKSKDDILSGVDGETLTSKKFLKVDILGLKTLDIIDNALENIKRFEKKQIDIYKLNINDGNVLTLFREIDVDNIFQFDTRLMRGYKYKSYMGMMKFKPGLLQRIQPDKFEHLVELNALNRPGPLSLHMDEPYEKRRFGEKYEIPKLLENHLKSTYGILLYQEQMNSILQDWLDVDEGVADILRRKVEDSNLKDILNSGNYFEHLYKKYNKEDVEKAIDFLQHVGGYSFCRSHAWSYSYLAYQLMYLKCYYRKYFNLACLDNEDDEIKIKKLIDDCLANGIKIRPYNLNEISYNFIFNEKGEIIPGIKVLKGLGDKSIAPIIANKPFRDLADFLIRARVSRNILILLNEAGFFLNSFGKSINIDEIKPIKVPKSKKLSNTATLF